MKSILICFANDEKESLVTLKEERARLSKLFDTGASQKHFSIKEIPHATIENVYDGLTSYIDSLRLFLFSGHANRNSLVFEDGAANAAGIVDVLRKCTKLKLVVLNGCSTVGQVKELLNLPSKPAVIATSAPVEDRSATIFSITLFELMVNKEKTLQEAFDLSIGKLKLKSSIAICNSRELVDTDDAKGVWGLFLPRDKTKRKNWRIPAKSPKTKPQTGASHLSNIEKNIINSKVRTGRGGINFGK